MPSPRVEAKRVPPISTEHPLIDFCLVGGGFIGPLHAANIAAHPSARLAWVVDLDAAAADKLAGKYGARATSNLDAALADPAVGAVMICTPPRTHAPIIERAARAGKAVFCEKPVDLDLARVDACAKVLEATGTPFFVAFNRRFDPSHRALFDAIRAGDIGRPEMLVLSSRDPEISPPDYVAAMPYGIFYDTMIHDFDMVRWLLRRGAGRDRRAHRVHAGRGRESAPRSRHGDGDADDGERRARARQFELPRGLRLRPADRGLRLEGHADLAQPPADRARALRRRRDPPRPAAAVLHRALRAVVRARARRFHSGDRNRQAPSIGLDDGRRALRIAEAAVASAKSGAPVRINS